MSEIYGPKRIIGFTIFSGGISAILSPVVARSSFIGFIALRVIQGLCQVNDK